VKPGEDHPKHPAAITTATIRLSDLSAISGSPPQRHAKQKPHSGHDAVAVADAHVGLGQVQLEPADILKGRGIGGIA
jgi:hypothetical protein